MTTPNEEPVPPNDRKLLALGIAAPLIAQATDAAATLFGSRPEPTEPEEK